MLELSRTTVNLQERRFSLRTGTALAELDDAWVARSAASSSSHVLNDECAAILRLLADHQAAGASDICTWLARDFDEDPSRIAEMVAPLWDQLIELGLINEHPCPTRP